MKLKCTYLFLAHLVLFTTSELESLFEKRLLETALTTTETLPAVRFDAEKDVMFLLYTKKNPVNPEYISVGDAASLGSFSLQHTTKVVVHGWKSKPAGMDVVRMAYIDSGEDCNVIMVDWSKGASDLLYNVAKGRVVSVGERVAELLDFFISRGLSLSNVHLVGHSLGGHVVGVAANRMKSGKVARITGLDPAAPGYGTESLANRLDSSDAVYVEVIHTCAGVLGWADPLGHSDFFPNGGTMIQPGCGHSLSEIKMGSCSHHRSVLFFAESITTKKGFVGVRCSNWKTYKSGACSSNDKELMGDKTPTSVVGTFYLKTASSSPFAEG